MVWKKFGVTMTAIMNRMFTCFSRLACDSPRSDSKSKFPSIQRASLVWRALIGCF